MGPELTTRYRSVFEAHRLRAPLAFARDVYASGKWRELSSFVTWELLHRLHLFPSRAYLQFTADEPLKLTTEGTEATEFNDTVARLFAARGLHSTACEQNWRLLYLRSDGVLFGCRYPHPNELCQSEDGREIKLLYSFPEPIKAIFVSSAQIIFVCVKRAVYRGVPNYAFERVLELASAESFFRHNNGMTELPDGTLVIGEYGNEWKHDRWKKLAFLYFSSDGGVNWVRSDFLIRRGTNKHVHVVKYSGTLNKLFVTDGDNYKKLWVSEAAPLNLRGETKWTAANRFHIQMGGYTSIVESEGKVFFGTDYQGGTNFLVDSADGLTYRKRIIPDPYRRSPVDNMVLRKSHTGTEIWANLPYSTAASKCLLMFSSDSGSSWSKVLEYNRSCHVVWLISSSSEAATELYISIENLTTKHRAVYKVGDHQ